MSFLSALFPGNRRAVTAVYLKEFEKSDEAKYKGAARQFLAVPANREGEMWEALENVGWIQTLSTTGWMYASVSVCHYLCMFWCIGSISIMDLRVMGLAVRNRNAEELSHQLFPWAWTGFALAMISGFLMFATDASDWAPSPVFHIKLTLIGISVLFAAVIQYGVPKWSRAAEIPTAAKVIALISILLWIVTILSASEIPAMEGLG